jgi:hypothetical protein
MATPPDISPEAAAIMREPQRHGRFPSYRQIHIALSLVRAFVDRHEAGAALLRPGTPRRALHELWDAAGICGQMQLAGAGHGTEATAIAAIAVAAINALMPYVSSLSYELWARVDRRATPYVPPITFAAWATILGAEPPGPPPCSAEYASARTRPLEWIESLTEVEYGKLTARH